MPKFLVLPELCCVRNIEAKFKTLGLSMWSLALHGTFLDGLADIMEEIRALETIGLSFEMVWVMSLFFTIKLCGFGDQVVCFQSVFAFAAFALLAFSVSATWPVDAAASLQPWPFCQTVYSCGSQRLSVCPPWPPRWPCLYLVSSLSPTGCHVRSGGRLCTRFLGSQVHADGSGPGSQVHADGSGPGSQVHADGSGQGRKGNGLVCTRGQGPRLYTRNGFAVCTPLFLQLCILCAPCVQVVRYRSLAVLPLCILCATCVQVVRFITMLFGHV